MSHASTLPIPESPATAPPTDTAPPREATYSQVLGAAASLALLGAAAGLGSGSLEVALRAIPSALAIGFGTLALAAPPLLVAHQFLALHSPPEAMVEQMARGTVRLGVLALGLAPVVLFFSITSRLALPLFATLFAVSCGYTLLRLVRSLAVLERDSVPDDVLAPVASAGVLFTGWVGLVALIALRLAADVGWFVLAPTLVS